MFKMKFLLILCVVLAITNFVSARPQKEDYDEGDLLNDEDGDNGNYNGDDELESEELEDKDDITAVENKPRMISEPLTIEAVQGDNIELPCLTDYSDAYVIFWKQNGNMLFQDKLSFGVRNEHYQRLDNQSLYISNVQEGDSGEYECSVSIPPPDFVAIKHNLTVKVPASIVKVTANDQINRIQVQRNQHLELICEAKGFPKPKVSWSKSGVRLRSEEFNSNIVSFENVGRDDSGIYTCLADNGVGKPAFESIAVNVTHSPDIKVERIIVGENELELICKVHAHPKAEVHWLKNGKRIPHTHRGNENVVDIKDFGKSNFGNYTCIASNEINTVEKHLHVSGVPTVPKYDKALFVDPDNQSKTTWSVSSMSPITAMQIQYRIKGGDKIWKTEPVEFQAKEGHMYDVEIVLKNLESGVYELRARTQNKYGWSEYSKAVTIEGKPTISGASRTTIFSWTSILSLFIMNLYSKYI